MLGELAWGHELFLKLWITTPGKLAWGYLAAAHRIAAVVAQVAIAIANGDRAAVIAARGVRLETSELIIAPHDLLATGRFVHGNARAL